MILLPYWCCKGFRPKSSSRIMTATSTQHRKSEKQKCRVGKVLRLDVVAFLMTVVYSIQMRSSIRRSTADDLQMAVRDIVGSNVRGDNMSRNSTGPSLSAVILLSESLKSLGARVHPPSPIDGPVQTGPHTIVTAFFALRSKHKLEDYKKWMKNLLGVQDPMVIFTQRDMLETMLELRRHARNRTVIVEVNIHDLPIARYRGKNASSIDFWQQQLDMDREKRMHRGYEVFWIWLSKSWFVVQTTHLNPFHSDIFMYTDIGCFRRAQRIMSQTLIRKPQSVLPDHDTVVWMAHHKPNPPPNPIWNDKFRQREHYYHSGSQAIGHGTAWQRFHREFAIVVDEFVRADLFIGEDQCVLQGTCQRRPKYCAYVPFNQVPDNHYFGLRTVVRHGGSYKLWRAPEYFS